MIKLVAHRGYQRKFPENTLLGFTEAITAGACHVETDVQLSADAIPVLYHDDSMRRISEVEGAIQWQNDLLEVPIWQLAQWNSQSSIITSSPQHQASGAFEWANRFKAITMGPHHTTGSDLMLSINSDNELN